MKSNYKPIGNYIMKVECRNRDLKVKRLLGLSMTKEFRETTSNIVGTDMSVYRVMSKYQFACDFMSPIRVNKLPVVLKLDDEPNLVSPAYPVFEIKDRNELDPEYLMMWFRRNEFDRYAAFKCDAAIRGGYEWKELCETLIPVPGITKQREIVKEYNVIQNRIKINQQVIEKLEETAQSIYKRWFEDFEFPNDNGNPYKSNGGEMVWNEELQKDIPIGWNIDCLSGIATYTNGLAMQKFPTQTNEFLPVIKIRELTLGCTDDSSDKASLEIPKQYIIQNGDILFSWSGTLKVEIWVGGVGGLNQHIFKVTSKKFEKWYYYLCTKFHLREFNRIAEGKATSLGHIKREHLKDAKVLVPLNVQIRIMNKFMAPILNTITNKKIEMRILKNMNDILLSKLSTIEN
jgi:type I restriction enzyme S subunit